MSGWEVGWMSVWMDEWMDRWVMMDKEDISPEKNF